MASYDSSSVQSELSKVRGVIMAKKVVVQMNQWTGKVSRVSGRPRSARLGSFPCWSAWLVHPLSRTTLPQSAQGAHKRRQKLDKMKVNPSNSVSGVDTCNRQPLRKIGPLKEYVCP